MSQVPTVIVCSKGSGEYVTVRDATEDVEPGTRILVRPGEYADRILIDKPLEIIGMGDVRQIILKVFERPAITSRATLLVRGITILHSSGERKHRVEKHYGIEQFEGNLTLDGCSIETDDEGCIALMDGDHWAEISNTFMKGGNGATLSIGEQAQAKISGTRIHDSWSHGVLAKAESQIELLDTTIEKSRSIGLKIEPRAKAHLSHCQIRTSGTHNLDVASCTSFEAYESLSEGAEQVGCFFHEGSEGKVMDCQFINCKGGGMAVLGGSSLNLNQVILRENGKFGLEVSQTSNVSGTQVELIGNVERNLRVFGQAKLQLGDSKIEKAAGIGGEISKGANCVFDSCTIQDNDRQGLSISGAALTLTRSHLNVNHEEGIVLTTEATLQVEETSFMGNLKAGCIAELSSTAKVVRCQFQSGKGQGIVFRDRAIGHLEGSQLFANEFTSIEVVDRSKLAIHDCQISSGRVGLTNMEGSECTIEDCEFLYHSGPAIVVGLEARVAIKRSRIAEGQQQAIYCYEDVGTTIDDCEISANVGDQIVLDRSVNARLTRVRVLQGKRGGIVMRSHAVAHLDRCVIQGCGASGLAVRGESKATVTDCRVKQATTFGIKLSTGSEAMIDRTTIAENKVGGLLVRQEANLHMSNSKINENMGWGIRACESANLNGQNLDLQRNIKGEHDITSDVEYELTTTPTSATV